MGLLAHPISSTRLNSWKLELAAPGVAKKRAALLHIRLGESLLAKDHQPEQAQGQFAQAKVLTKSTDALHGLATYDNAIAYFYEGAYQDASEAFHALIAPGAPQLGYDHMICARFYKHASACAGYHAERSEMGIPEPPRLDPNCAAAALATCLRPLGVAYDKRSVPKGLPRHR